MLLTNDGEKQIIYKDDVKLMFDQLIRTSTGYVGGINLKSARQVQEELGMSTIAVNTYHKKLGHACESHTRLTARMNLIDLKGPFEPCEDCGLGKIEKKKMNKVTQKEVRWLERESVLI